MSEWDYICFDTYRMKVEGGWMYRYSYHALCFVPSLAPSKPKEVSALLPVVQKFVAGMEAIDIESEEVPDNHVNGTSVETLTRKI